MISIDILRDLCKNDKIAITNHAKKRLFERNIYIDDVISTIISGEIIEQYDNDKPFPSCLISGKAENGNNCHTVVSFDGEFIYLITAYYPDLKNWYEDFKTRKEQI